MYVFYYLLTCFSSSILISVSLTFNTGLVHRQCSWVRKYYESHESRISFIQTLKCIQQLRSWVNKHTNTSSHLTNICIHNISVIAKCDCVNLKNMISRYGTTRNILQRKSVCTYLGINISVNVLTAKVIRSWLCCDWFMNHHQFRLYYKGSKGCFKTLF